MNLALNMKAVVSQRLVVGTDGRRLPATEVLINTPMIRDLLRRITLEAHRHTALVARDPYAAFARIADEALPTSKHHEAPVGGSFSPDAVRPVRAVGAWRQTEKHRA